MNDIINISPDALPDAVRVDAAAPGIEIEQYVNGFLYGTDAVCLAKYVTFAKGSVGAELGTGTGIIPILICSEKKPKKIYAFEIQEKYALLASKNAARNSMDDRIEVICADLKDASAVMARKNIFSGMDFVFSNPPYMKLDSGYLNETDELLIARHEKAATIDDVCASASKLLRNGGDFFMVYRPDRLCDLFCALRSAHLEPKDIRFISGRRGLQPKLCLVKAKKGAFPGNTVSISYLEDEASE